MKKSLLNLGTVLDKTQQKTINGGDTDVFQHEGVECYYVIDWIDEIQVKEKICNKDLN